MVGLVWREHSCHLVMVGGMDVFINTVPGQLYLLRIAQVTNRHAGSLLLLLDVQFSWIIKRVGALQADLRQSQMHRRRL